MNPLPLNSRLSTGLALAAVLLAGCDMSPTFDGDAGFASKAAVESINPYPPGAPTPFFYSAQEWDRYAGTAPPKQPSD